MERKFPKPVIQARESGFILKKVNLDGNIISKEAEFDLYPADDNQKIATGITNENGEIVFEHLRVSAFDEGYSYYLVEKRAPEGHVKCEDAFKITIFSDHVAVEEDNAWISVDEDGKVVVMNAEYVEPLDIPITGGKGIEMFYMIGILLLVGGVICLKRNYQN